MDVEDRPGGARYTAFLSYSHHDKAFACRLQSRLERYRLPHGVRARGTGETLTGRVLGPVFRDQDDLPAAPNLTEAVRGAIAESEWLIVICSPDAVASHWVDREIHLFRALRGEGKILAALLRGEPAEAFPPAMLEAVADAPAPDPVAADFRPHGDGDHLAFLKLVAALAGVEVDALAHRDAHRRTRRMATLSAASFLGVAVMGALTTAAILARNAAITERNRSVKVVDYMLGDMRSRLKGVGRLDVLQAGNEGALRYYQGQNIAHLPLAAVIEHAKLLQSMGDDDTKRGDLASARHRFDEAERETTALIRAHPNDPKVIYAHAQSRYWSGYVRWREDDLAGAKVGFDDYATLARRLVALEPKNPEWRMEVGYADSNLGLFALRQRVGTSTARKEFTAALADFDAALANKPGDRDVREQIADGYAWMADTERLAGNYAAAEAWRDRQSVAIAALLGEDPNDSSAETLMVSNTLGRARIALAVGDPKEAIALIQQGRRQAAKLASNDPKNLDAAREARVFDLFEVSAWADEPESRRPSRKRLQAVLGDCAAERDKAANEELATFCYQLDNKMKGIPPAAHQFGPRLSERWLIDLKAASRP